ncbi:copper amine oxidase N-terminal domain-containing protein [Paenibacillus wulumuqiensis]|uniref:copper amine oxidase N-terminal domain-containing protein n=1 Tax=Paenibacillus wulumuqiensis TaxID=1567107 RepID=UPI0006197997|nr:copper amine oxidase N-terminal domain-containing protein [Paenibacillus wulumuqiensis]
MKKLIAASIAAGLLLSSTPTYASPVSITTPDQQTIKGSDAQIREGRKLIPIRDLARAIDATLAVDSVHHKVTLKKWGEVYTFTIGKARYRVNKDNDPTSELTVPFQQIKGRTYIPVNFLMPLGYQISTKGSQLSIHSPLSEKDRQTLYHGDLASARQLATGLLSQIPKHGEKKLLQLHYDQESESVENHCLFPAGKALQFYHITADTVSFIEFKEDFPVITWQAHLPQNSSDALKDFLNFKLKDKWGSVPVKNTDYLYNMYSYLGDSSMSITGIVNADGGYNRTGYEYEVGGGVTDAGGKLSFVMPGEQRTD